MLPKLPDAVCVEGTRENSNLFSQTTSCSRDQWQFLATRPFWLPALRWLRQPRLAENRPAGTVDATASLNVSVGVTILDEFIGYRDFREFGSANLFKFPTDTLPIPRVLQPIERPPAHFGSYNAATKMLTLATRPNANLRGDPALLAIIDENFTVRRVSLLRIRQRDEGAGRAAAGGGGGCCAGGRSAGSGADRRGREVAEAPATAAIDVSRNAGSATVKLGAKAHVLKHVAAFRTKRDGDDKTRLVFSELAISWQRMQTMLAKEEDFSFGDLYEVDVPGSLTLQVDEYWGFSFSAGGVRIGDGMDDPEGEIKVEDGRACGAVMMRAPK